MKNLILWLQGKKSYIVLFIGFVFNLGVISGWWATDNTTWQSIDTLLATLLGLSFRSAISKNLSK